MVFNVPFGMTSLAFWLMIIILFIFLVFIVLTLVHMFINKRFGWFWATIILTLLGLVLLGFIIIIIYWIIRIVKGKK